MSSQLDLSFLRDRRVQRRIALVALAAAVVGAAYALLTPPWYRAAVTVVPARQQRSGGISSLLGGDLGGLAAAAGLEGVAGGADSPRIAAVLQSTAVSDAVIEKFGLRDRYDKKYQEDARDKLWDHCDVKPQPKPNLVKLSCEDKDPVFVQQMLAYFAEYGNQVFSRVSVSSASEQVRFLEKRVAELRQQADETSARMRAFQEQHQIVDIDTQTKAVVGSIASLQAQRIGKQLELDYARTYSSQGEGTLRQLESQLAIVNEKLRELEEARPPEIAVPTPSQKPEPRARRGKEMAGGLFPAALDVPKLRAEYEKIYRDRRVAEATLIVALERLEGARADEAREVSTFQVLDPPTVPTKRSRPKRTLTVLAAAVLGLVAAAAYEWWRAGGLKTLLWARADAGAPQKPPEPRPGLTKSA